MRIPLKTEYKTLTIYCVIYASMSLQFKLYRPKFEIKLLSPAVLHLFKHTAAEHMALCMVQHPKHRQKASQVTCLKRCF